MIAARAARSGRRGYALLAVIATIVVAELLVLGLWRVAAGSTAAANESATRTTSRLAAESALRLAVTGWDDAAVATRPPGIWYAVPAPAGTTGTVGTTVDAVNLYRGVRLLRATATVTSSGRVRARVSVEASLSAVPTDELWRDFHSAVVTAGDVAMAPGDTVDGMNAGLPSPWTPAECPPASLPATGARPGIALGSNAIAIATGAVTAGAPPVLSGAARANPADFDRLGSVDLADFAAIADRLESGSIALSPASSGTICDVTLRGNWGEPGIAGHPCHDYFPIVFADRDTDITAGSGQGILIVDGHLHIAAGVRFYGAILVRGSIDTDGAMIHGSLRIAGNGATSRLRGAFRYEECALARAFRLAPGLRKLYRVSDRWWLPAF